MIAMDTPETYISADEIASRIPDGALIGIPKEDGGVAMEVTGLVEVIAGCVHLLPAWASHGFALTTIVVTLAVVMSTFMSNTAAANVLVPMVVAVGTASGGAGVGGQLAILTALACSFAMAMPVSTPPNAIAFATGKIPAIALVRSGGLVSMICIIVLLMGYQLVIPWILRGVSLGGLP